MRANLDFDGVNIIPYVNGEVDGAPHEALYFRRDDDYAIRKGDWKLEWNDRDIQHPEDARKVLLFNLANDPFETTNLMNTYPEKAKALQDDFDAWDSKLPDSPWWGGPINRKASDD